uniref:Kinesin motor domain-containing protein n=1 Tax=Leersia perrieri TaxID=77586 RepID=A0A0D9VZJ7_9ORYZ
MPSIRAPDSKQTATLQVAVKCRPLTDSEQRRSRHIIQVIDDKNVVVLDPDLSKDYLEIIQNRTKERRYCFDHVYAPGCSNADVYKNISSTIAGVVQGLNATVFAYGSTGSGKTYTMVGTHSDPGLMVLSFRTIFDLVKKDDSKDTFEVSCSYLEVYNEVIYDLLEKSSGHLELREDPEHGIMVAGLRRIKVHSADKILELLNIGNSRRKTESTEANSTSSRSHAVLEITVKRKQKGQYGSQVLRGKLALVDLAGSKLTRILKDGLSGNSRTVMVATISPADDQYHHTTNTLKYADRAKEIKTHVHKNIGHVDTHVEDYKRMIDNLQIEVSQLKKELAEKEHQLSVKPTEKAADNELSWLNILSQETGENVQERINLQKALFELEETNKRNRMELQHLDDAIARQQDIELNESRRRQLQAMIEEATSNNGNRTYLHILSQYRLLGMTNAELQIEMAMRDQVIHNQRESLRSLWSILYGTGLNQKQILKLATKQGLTIEGCPLPVSSPDVTPPSFSPHGRLSPFMSFPSPQSQPYSPSACFVQHGFSTMSYLKNQHETPTICRQEHLSSYYMMSECSPFDGDGKQRTSGRSMPYFCTPGKPKVMYNFSPGTESERSPCSKIPGIQKKGSEEKHQDPSILQQLMIFLYYQAGRLQPTYIFCQQQCYLEFMKFDP